MQPANNSFGKEKHLKSRKQIDQLFAGGKAFFVHPIKVFWRLGEMTVNEMQTTDDGRRTTEKIQPKVDSQQTADDIQPTAGGRPKADAIQTTDEIQDAINKQITEQINANDNRIPSSIICSPSSVVHRPSVSVGVSASKRNFKKAVDRNRVKRLLREAYRLNQQDLLAAMESRNDCLQVFFIFVDKTIPTFALVQEKMVICLKKLQKIAGETKNEKLL